MAGMMMELGRIAAGEDIASGIVGGILVCGGIMSLVFSAFFFVPSLAFLIAGLVCVADAAFPFGRQPHMGSLIGGFMAGFGMILAFFAMGIAYWVCFCALIVFLLSLLMRRRAHSKKVFKT
jgi:hypothetical protein